MKRERMLQVAVGLLGLLYVALIYPLYTDLDSEFQVASGKEKRMQPDVS